MRDVGCPFSCPYALLLPVARQYNKHTNTKQTGLNIYRTEISIERVEWEKPKYKTSDLLSAHPHLVSLFLNIKRTRQVFTCVPLPGLEPKHIINYLRFRMYGGETTFFAQQNQHYSHISKSSFLFSRTFMFAFRLYVYIELAASKKRKAAGKNVLVCLEHELLTLFRCSLLGILSNR